MNTKSNASSGAGDDRQDAWEATFFSPDGSETTQTGQKSADATTAKSKPADPLAEPSTDLNADPAKAERLAGQAQESIQEHVEELGEVLHEKFIQLLTQKVSEKDGQLSATDIEEMGEEFRSQLQDIETVFLNAVESYTLAREKTRVDQARGNLFHRLMVKKFEHRFADEETLQKQPELLSRRMLPGYLNMILVMFGDDRLENYETRTRKLIDKLRRDAGGQLDWADVYKSPEARKITLLAEVDIARRFDDIDKRLEWMTAIVNSNLIPADDDLAGTPWTFNKSAAEWLLTSLLDGLRPAMENATTRAKLGERMGTEALQILDSVARRFS